MFLVVSYNNVACHVQIPVAPRVETPLPEDSLGEEQPK